MVIKSKQVINLIDTGFIKGSCQRTVTGLLEDICQDMDKYIRLSGSREHLEGGTRSKKHLWTVLYTSSAVFFVADEDSSDLSTIGVFQVTFLVVVALVLSIPDT